MGKCNFLDQNGVRCKINTKHLYCLKHTGEYKTKKEYKNVNGEWY
jgi:hypothetical protein